MMTPMHAGIGVLLARMIIERVAPSGLATALVERGKHPLVILIQRGDVLPVLL
jgi:hypothetical protein